MDTLGNIPIKVTNGVVLLPAKVNGAETVGFLDSGAYETLITPELAAAAKLTTATKAKALGVTGSFSFAEGSAASIEVGDLVLRDAPSIGVFSFGGSHGRELGINLGADFLEGLDYDIDFPHETIRVYRYMSCYTIDPPWPTMATRLNLSRGVRDYKGDNCILRCGLASLRQIALPVAFPGGTVLGTFDTGSTRSLLSYEGALAAGVSREALAADPNYDIMAIDNGHEAGKLHRFDHLYIGNSEISNIDIAVRMTFDRRDSPMLVGMDIIGRYHLWLSYSTSTLYIDTGIKRDPTPPLEKPHLVGVTTLPVYPRDGNGGAADLDVNCWVETDGRLTACEVSNNTAGKNFADAALEWLSGPSHPFVQPAYANNQPIRQRHGWHVHLAPPGG